MRIESNVSLRPYNTFGIDAVADRMIHYATVGELQKLLKAKPSEIVGRYLHIGRGSNLLFTKNFEGTILHSEIRSITALPERNDAVFYHVGSGVVWDDFCDEMARKNLFGCENLSLIPGEVGAAAVQNIGAYGVEIKDLITEVHTIERANGTIRIFPREACLYGYRDSIFKEALHGRYIVTSVVLKLSKKPLRHLDYGNLREELGDKLTPSAMDIRNAVIAIRRRKLPDPEDLGNAGSFFKNPVVSRERFLAIEKQHPNMPHYTVDAEREKIPAAWLIDRCGLKGHRVGDAEVYEQQPLVIVNRGKATPDDIVALSYAVQKAVFDRFEIAITPEVNFI